jgi:hypothetical protein
MLSFRYFMSSAELCIQDSEHMVAKLIATLEPPPARTDEVDEHDEVG